MIGIFDSGLGGLTALKELRELCPECDIVYFGDTGRVPYGTRSRDILYRYADEDIKLLLSKGAERILDKIARAAHETLLFGRIIKRGERIFSLYS